MYGRRLVSLDLSGMVAGTKYRGDFEERIKISAKDSKVEEGTPTEKQFIFEFDIVLFKSSYFWLDIEWKNLLASLSILLSLSYKIL